MSKIAKVRKSYEPMRASPFKVSWRLNKERFSRFFQTEKEQEDFANQMVPFLSGDKSEILCLDTPTIGDIISINKSR